jgi:hypothetical protein
MSKEPRHRPLAYLWFGNGPDRTGPVKTFEERCAEGAQEVAAKLERQRKLKALMRAIEQGDSFERVKEAGDACRWTEIKQFFGESWFSPLHLAVMMMKKALR